MQRRRAFVVAGIDVGREGGYHDGGARGVDSMPCEQFQPVGEPVLGGPVDLPPPHLLTGLHGLAQAEFPRARPGIGQPVGEQQLQMRIVGAKHPVVEGLLIHRVCAALQQNGGQRFGEGVPGLTSRPLLTLAEHPRQRGERSGQTAPEVSRVRIGAGVQKQARGRSTGT